MGGIGCAGIILLLVLGAFLVPRIFDSDDDPPDIGDNSPDNPLAGDSPLIDNSGQGWDLGQVVSAAAINQDNCPVDVTNEFASGDSIYIVAEDSDIPSGTVVFARLFYEGTVQEDAPEITADRDYENSCVTFVFEPTQGESFDPGTYEAQFIVNGNEAETVQFEVR